MDATELLQAVIDSPIQHAIVMTDAEGMIRLWNTGAERIFQYRENEVVGRDARFLFSVDDRAHGIPDKEMARALRDGCAGDFRWHARKDGALFWADGMIYPVHSRGGEHMGFVKVLRDATEQKHAGDATSRLALEDSLTGLPNRTEFRHRFVDMAALAQRHNRQLVLLLLDLDRFKPVNDELGHAAGDAVLQQAAHRMRAVVRDTDFVARLGGDEFAILLPDVESIEAGGAVAGKLIKSLSRTFLIGERRVHIGASIGISVYPQDAVEFDPLFGKADLALYRAKAEGRGAYRFHTAQMDANAHRRSLEQAQMRRAVKDREFSISYQPQVDADGQVVAVEALLRCSNPFFAGYGTDRLVGLALATGRLRRLGSWALAEASRQTRQWQLEGSPDLHLSMNFCRVELAGPRFAQRVIEVLARTGLATSHLEIDIAEPQLADGFDPAPIAELHASGVSIAIDDLGSGGLSFKHLFNLPIDTLKLDVGMIPDLPSQPHSRAIVRAASQLGHTLGMRVVAERVETQAQADYVRPLFDGMQGYHCARPMDADEMGEWLQKHAKGDSMAAKVSRRLGKVFGGTPGERNRGQVSRH